MKVICIENGYITTSNGSKQNAPELTEGNIYTIISETPRGYGYVLEEVKSDTSWGYSKKRFIPLSEIDEMELVNQNKQLA